MTMVVSVKLSIKALRLMVIQVKILHKYFIGDIGSHGVWCNSTMVIQWYVRWWDGDKVVIGVMVRWCLRYYIV